MAAEDIIAIYKKRWLIENLFKQLKQNFPLRYFYGERANAIKIWITLIANLFITLVKNKIKRPWSFSGLATMIRILLMSYVSIQSFFEQQHRDWERLITQVKAPPEEGWWYLKLELIMSISAGLGENIAAYSGFIGQQYITIQSL